jgi:hypothetical protein
MTTNMIQLPIQPPIYPNTGSLPAGATPGSEAVVLSTPPTIYIYDGSSWVLVTSGGTTAVDSVTSAGLGLTASPTTGDVVLTLAQSILTNATPTFASIILSTTPTIDYVWTCTNGTTGEGSWQVNAASGGITAIGTYDGQTAVANGLRIVGNELFAQSATGAAPGMISLADQVMGDGIKKFQDEVWITTTSNFLSLGATNPTVITSGINTLSRTLTLPDADSNTIIPTTATANQWVTNITSGGVQTKAQPAFSNISGLLDLTTQVTGILPVANGGTNLSSFGTANQLLGVNAGATALEYKTIQSGTAGTDFNIAFAANAITINLPDASATNRGAVTTGIQSLAGAKTFLASLLISAAANQIVLGSTFTTTINSAVTANRTCTLVDANSNTIIPTSAVSNQFVTNITSGGVQNLAAVSATGLSGIVPIANGGTALSTTPTDGQLLVGNGTNYTLATLTQASANRVLITNAAGSITISTPQDINTSSNVQFGTLGVNGAVASNTVFSVNGSNAYRIGMSMSGNLVNPIGAVVGLSMGHQLAPTTGTAGAIMFNGAGSVVMSSAGSVTAAIWYSATPFLAGSGSIGTVYGFYSQAMTNSSLTITRAYGGYFTNPNIGTNKNALYTDDLSVGYTSITPATGQLAVSGRATFGTSTIPGGSSASQVTVSSATIPEIIFAASGAATDTKYWAFGSNSSTTNNTFFGYSWNDALSSTSNWIQVQRIATSHVIQYVRFPVGSIVFGSTSDPVNKVDIVGGVAIGAFATVNAAPANGLIVSGVSACGSSSPSSATQFTVSPISSAITAGISINGAFSGSSQVGIEVVTSFTNAASFAQPFLSSPKFAAATATSISSASCFYASPFYTGNIGTVTKSVGYLYDGGGSLVGSVTAAYGAYLDVPVAGTTKMALWANGASFGASNTTTEPPTNGILTQTFKMNTSPIAGYVMTSDSAGVGTWQPTGAAGITVYKVTQTAVDYAVLTSDYCIDVTAVGAPFRSIALPYINGIPYAAPPNGTAFLIKDSSQAAATNNIVITVSAPGGGTFEGGLTTKTISTNGGYFEFILSGSTWLLIGQG